MNPLANRRRATSPDWDLSGIVDDTRLLFREAYEVANGSVWPTWKTGSEFRARREQAPKARQ